MRSLSLLLLAAALGACSSSSTPADASAPTDGSLTEGGSPDGGGCAPGTPQGAAQVATAQGVVRGVASGGAMSFLGIPYTQPPVGSLRWRPPTEPACFSGTFDATRFGSLCPQLDASNNPTGNEDCLTLNVWVPSARPAGPMPVLFFLHGGGNYTGSTQHTSPSGALLYDGAYLAEHGQVMVVTANYRLGALGFLGHTALSAESPQHASGNYGLLDQLAALRWVQRNAAAFGGDASRVLLFGESAGGLDTCALLTSPLAAGLFSRALLESGGCTASPLATVEQGGAMLATNASCASAADVLACLRALPADAVVRALPGTTGVAAVAGAYRYALAVDNYVLPDKPSALLAAGRYNRMPLVLGTNRDEYAFFYPPTNGHGSMTDADYQALVRMQFPASSAAVLALYPSAMYASPYFAYVDLFSDATFTCAARSYARSVAAGAMAPAVRRYFFTQVEPNAAAAAYGSAHGFELPYVFHNFGGAPTAQQEQLSAAIQGYWTRFAATGDPNGAGAPSWPAWDAGTDPYLELGATVAASAGLRTRQCDAWDRAMLY